MREEQKTEELIDLGVASVLTLGDPADTDEGIDLEDKFV